MGSELSASLPSYPAWLVHVPNWQVMGTARWNLGLYGKLFCNRLWRCKVHIQNRVCVLCSWADGSPCFGEPFNQQGVDEDCRDRRLARVERRCPCSTALPHPVWSGNSGVVEAWAVCPWSLKSEEKVDASIMICLCNKEDSTAPTCNLTSRRGCAWHRKALCSTTRNVAPVANFRLSGLDSVLYFRNFYLFIYLLMLLLGPRAVALWQNAWVSVPEFGWLCPLQTSIRVLASPRGIHLLLCCVPTVHYGCGKEHCERQIKIFCKEYALKSYDLAWAWDSFFSLWLAYILQMLKIWCLGVWNKRPSGLRQSSCDLFPHTLVAWREVRHAGGCLLFEKFYVLCSRRWRVMYQFWRTMLFVETRSVTGSFQYFWLTKSKQYPEEINSM